MHLYPYYSVLTSTTGYTGNGNIASNPNFASQYCDGSRQPPESGTSGWAVPPGIADATVPNPIFNLTPVATVDEGNNWINLRWGPLSLVNPVTLTQLGNYALTAGSGVIDAVPTSEPNYSSLVPKTDFFGHSRPEGGVDATFDPGAVEFQSTVAGPTLSTILPTSGVRGTTVNVTLTGTNLTGATWNAVTNLTFGAITVAPGGLTATSSITIASGASLGVKNLSVTTAGGPSGTVAFTVTGATLTIAAPVNIPLFSGLTSGGTGTKYGSVTVTNSSTATGQFTFTAAPSLITSGTQNGTYSLVTSIVLLQPLPGTCTSSTVLIPGGSCTVVVKYVPTTTTSSSAHVRVTGTGIATSPQNGTNFSAN